MTATACGPVPKGIIQRTQPGEYGTQMSYFLRLLQPLNVFGSINTQFLSEGGFLLKVMLYIPLKHKSVGCLLSLLYNEIKAIINGYGSLEKCKLASPPQEKWIKLCNSYCTCQLPLFSWKHKSPFYIEEWLRPLSAQNVFVIIDISSLVPGYMNRVLYVEGSGMCFYLFSTIGEENLPSSLLGSLAGLMIKLTQDI